MDITPRRIYYADRPYTSTKPQIEEDDVALSDNLYNLADRAKQAEQKAKQAQQKAAEDTHMAKADLEKAVERVQGVRGGAGRETPR